MNGASASGPNTEEGREGSNGAAGEMDASERRESELGGTLNSCGLCCGQPQPSLYHEASGG